MASLVASVEGMGGLCGFAFATGLLWGRFSKPNIRLAFSKNVLVAPYKGGKAIMFRLANGRENALMEPEIIVSLTRETKQSDGTFKREYFRMNLELAKISYLPLTWTIVHPIDRESPFENWTRQDFESIDGEILIIFKAFDETYSNVVHKRYSYLLSDVVYNAQFKRAFYGAESGEVIVDLDRISDFEPIR
jgi:inward rectifier potassium channel